MLPPFHETRPASLCQTRPENHISLCADFGEQVNLTQTYWPHGAPSQLSNLVGLPSVSYGGIIGSTVGLDGEGRITQVTATSGQNPVTGATYNSGSLPTQVTLGSGDNDIFAYDPNTFRMTQFKFNVGTQSKYLNGALTWNANGTLGQLALTDQFNSTNSQTCNYTHDDLTRIAQADCGTGGWGQAFGYVSGVNAGYDPFGNLTKGVLSSHTGDSFQPTYSATTNQFTSIPGCSSLQYDSNGNLKNDCNYSYTWDADGNSITVDSVALTFDAFDRMVEQNRSGAYTQMVYGPGGGKLALMSGQTLQKAFVPLPGQATAVYTSSGLDHYRHSDWLGSARLTSSSTQSTGFISSLAYAPFGETYASSGTTDASFTGINPDTTGNIASTDYDFLAREYSNEGRWTSPDPAGLAAVDPSNPQSWNRYGYALNSPMNLVDPSGLYVVCDGIYSWDIVNVSVGTVGTDGSVQYQNQGTQAFLIGTCTPQSFQPWLTFTPPNGGGGGSAGGGPSSQVSTFLPSQGCTVSIFNPSCKPPSCPAVYVKGIVTELVGDGVSHAAAEGLAKPGIQAATQDAAVRYIAERGLVVPLRSSIVRRILLTGEILGEVVAALPIYYSEGVAFKDAYKQARAGTCTTIWSK